MKDKHIKRIRREILYYQHWIPLLMKKFKVNISVRDIRESWYYQDYINSQELKNIIHDNYRMLNDALGIKH